MLARAAACGVRLTGLSAYCHASRPAPSTAVIGFAGLKDEEIPELAGLLARAWRV